MSLIPIIIIGFALLSITVYFIIQRIKQKGQIFTCYYCKKKKNENQLGALHKGKDVCKDCLKRSKNQTGRGLQGFEIK